jgi:ribosome recycling factor
MKKDNVELWESRELGASEDHVGAVSLDFNIDIDDSLGLQAISIRLQKDLLKNLKSIAAYYDVGYQPMIRDLLNRFADSEIKKILRDQLRKIERERQSRSQDTTAPVDEFISDMQKRA